MSTEIEAPPGPEVLDEAYRAWSPDTSRVISGPLNHAKFPGTRYPTWRNARDAVSSKYTTHLFWTLGNRWFARIKKELPQ